VALHLLLFGEGRGGKGGATDLGEGEDGTACMDAKSQQSNWGSSWTSSRSRLGLGVRICLVCLARSPEGVGVAMQDGSGQAISAWMTGGWMQV
jgi:hypothetical protein